jgi:uncharacterized membrane protein
MVGLGDLPGGSFSSFAFDVSSNGSVIVGRGSNAIDEDDAFVWSENDGMQRVFDVLVDNGATGLTGWKLREATGISTNGRWIVGWGFNPEGQYEAFLADVAPVPISPSVFLFGSALWVMGWLRRKNNG